MTLRIAGKTLEKQIPNLMDWVDNPVSDPDLQAAGMVVRLVDEGIPGSAEWVQISLQEGAVLQEVVLGDPASSTPLEGYVSIDLQNGGRMTYTIHLIEERLPDVLPLHFKLATALTDHHVSFQFQNLPIPAAEPLSPAQATLVSWQRSTTKLVDTPSIVMEAQARWSLTVGFDAAGKPEPRPLEVAIDLVGEPATRVIAYGKLSLTESKTELGPLQLSTRGLIFEKEARDKLVAVQREYSLDEYPPDGTQIVYTFDPPEQPSQTIRRLAGQFSIVTAAGQKTTLLSDLLTTSEDPVSNADLNEAGVQLKLLRFGDNLTVTMLSGVPESIHNIELLDNSGYALPGVFGSRSSFGGAIEFSFQSAAPLPEKIQLQVTLNTGLEYIDLPFNFQDLPIPPEFAAE